MEKESQCTFVKSNGERCVHHIITRGVFAPEHKCRQHTTYAIQKARERNRKVQDSLPPKQTNIKCQFCNRVCKSNAGLAKHLTIHST